MQNNDIIIQSFGQRLKALRVQANMTQTELAGKIGSGQASVNCYEAGKQFPTLRILIRLSEVFNVSIDYIATGEDKDYYSLDDRYFIMKFHKLDARGKQNVMTLLETEYNFSIKK